MNSLIYMIIFFQNFDNFYNCRKRINSFKYLRVSTTFNRLWSFRFGKDYTKIYFKQSKFNISIVSIENWMRPNKLKCLIKNGRNASVLFIKIEFERIQLKQLLVYLMNFQIILSKKQANENSLFYCQIWDAKKKKITEINDLKIQTSSLSNLIKS